jgi:hypothetical protein
MPKEVFRENQRAKEALRSRIAIKKSEVVQASIRTEPHQEARSTEATIGDKTATVRSPGTRLRIDVVHGAVFPLGQTARGS